MKNIYLILLITVFIVSCKKNYSCKCTNPGGSYEVFSTKNTYLKAKRMCDDYYKTNFAGVSFNETSCNIK